MGFPRVFTGAPALRCIVVKPSLALSALPFCLLMTAAAQAAAPRHDGGPIPAAICIQPDAFQDLRRAAPSPTLPAVPPLYSDPMGGGGTNSFGKPIVNYVDLDPGSPGILDYRCGDLTYDGHQGTDITISDFYDMDEGVPVLCAAPGTVLQTHDGEFDRQTVWIPGA